MIPIQCGSAHHTTLAMYDPPESGPGKGGVVICYPWAREYFDAYRTMRFLARRLSQSGHHVLRFDYYGCGDSGGVFTDGGVECWTGDAATAVEELRALSGMRTVTVLGTRAGALIASRLAAERGDVDRIVLWDPIVDPAAYLDEAARRSREAGGVVPEDWPMGANDVTVEFDGYPFTRAMGRSALDNAIDVGAWRSVRSGLVVASVSPPGTYAPMLGRAAERSLALTMLNYPRPTAWNSEDEFLAGAIPLDAVEGIVAGLQ